MNQDERNPSHRHDWIMRTGVLGIACLVFGNTARAQGFTQQPGFVKYHTSPNVQVVSKLAYAKYKTRKLLLDLYLPLPSAKNRPGVVVIRGGGWLVGDRKRFAHIASALAERGIVAACIEYRTADKDAFPAAIQDVKAAVRWMRANAGQYGIDPRVVGTIGGSSGAHMALLAGLTPRIAEFEGNGDNPAISSEIQGVVAMAVPADLLTLTPANQAAVGKFLYATREQNNERWRWASPVNHIISNGPAVLLLHGANDDSVPPSQSTDFAERYRQAGANADLRILDGAPHAFWNYHPWFERAMDLAAGFFLHLETASTSRGSESRAN